MKTLRIKASLSLAAVGITVGAVSGLIFGMIMFLVAPEGLWKQLVVSWAGVVILVAGLSFVFSYIGWRKETENVLKSIISANSCFSFGLIK